MSEVVETSASSDVDVSVRNSCVGTARAGILHVVSVLHHSDVRKSANAVL